MQLNHVFCYEIYSYDSHMHDATQIKSRIFPIFYIFFYQFHRLLVFEINIYQIWYVFCLRYLTSCNSWTWDLPCQKAHIFLMAEPFLSLSKFDVTCKYSLLNLLTKCVKNG